MELVIGMVVAFLIGAYVRKPFEIKRKPKPIVAPQSDKRKSDKPTIEEQFFNMIMGTKDED